MKEEEQLQHEEYNYMNIDNDEEIEITTKHNDSIDEKPESMLSEMIQEISPKTIMGGPLKPNYMNEFINVATHNQPILSEARQIIMTSTIEHIDRTRFTGRIMQTPGGKKSPVAPILHFKQERLKTSEYVAHLEINDLTLRRNIERTNFPTTLVQMMSKQVGRDWETLAVGGSRDKYKDGSLLKTSNGWIHKCENKIYGEGKHDADFYGQDILEMLNAMIKKFPMKYVINRSDLRFYLDSNYFDMYIEEREFRSYKGVPVKEATVLNDDELMDETSGYGPTALLMDPDNMVYGIFHEITVELNRHPELKKTDYVISVKLAQGFENPEIGVVAFPETEKSSSKTMKK